MATRVWSAKNNLQVNSMTKIILTKWRKEANIQFHCFILTSIIGGFFFMFFPSSIWSWKTDDRKLSQNQPCQIRCLWERSGDLYQSWRRAGQHLGASYWWIYKMRGKLFTKISGWVDYCSGPFPSWRHSLTKSSNKHGSGTSLHHPKGTCRPVWHHSNARRAHFMLEEKGQWIDWVRNKLTYFNHVGQQKHPTKFVWESQFEVAMRGAALHRFQPSCQGEESLPPCSSLQRNSTPSSPKVFVDLHAGRFSARNAHQSKHHPRVSLHKLNVLGFRTLRRIIWLSLARYVESVQQISP